MKTAITLVAVACATFTSAQPKYTGIMTYYAPHVSRDVHLLHRRGILRYAEPIPLLCQVVLIAFGERPVGLITTTISVSHPFEAVNEAKVAAVVICGNVLPLPRLPVYFPPGA